MTQAAPERLDGHPAENSGQGDALLPSLTPDNSAAAVILARLDAMDATIATAVDGIERMLAMLDGFATRAEPLLERVEKRGARVNRFTRGATQ